MVASVYITWNEIVSHQINEWNIRSECNLKDFIYKSKLKAAFTQFFRFQYKICLGLLDSTHFKANIKTNNENEIIEDWTKYLYIIFVDCCNMYIAVITIQ